MASNAQSRNRDGQTALRSLPKGEILAHVVTGIGGLCPAARS
jgi:hypothetical protein